MLSIHLKWDFLRRRPEECDSSKKANQNQDSIRGSTPNVKERAGRLLQQNLPGTAASGCNKRVLSAPFSRSSRPFTRTRYLLVLGPARDVGVGRALHQ